MLATMWFVCVMCTTGHTVKVGYYNTALEARTKAESLIQGFAAHQRKDIPAFFEYHDWKRDRDGWMRWDDVVDISVEEVYHDGRHS